MQAGSSTVGVGSMGSATVTQCFETGVKMFVCNLECTEISMLVWGTKHLRLFTEAGTHSFADGCREEENFLKSLMRPELMANILVGLAAK